MLNSARKLPNTETPDLKEKIEKHLKGISFTKSENDEVVPLRMIYEKSEKPKLTVITSHTLTDSQKQMLKELFDSRPFVEDVLHYFLKNQHPSTEISMGISPRRGKGALTRIAFTNRFPEGAAVSEYTWAEPSLAERPIVSKSKAKQYLDDASVIEAMKRAKNAMIKESVSPDLAISREFPDLKRVSVDQARFILSPRAFGAGLVGVGFEDAWSGENMAILQAWLKANARNMTKKESDAFFATVQKHGSDDLHVFPESVFLSLFTAKKAPSGNAGSHAWKG